jgi:uncharacterized membrane protein
MFSEVKPIMNICIKRSVELWLKSHPKTKQWLWFIVLWFGGLITVTALSYPIKMLINNFLK